jgi:hypothetical protein
MSTAIVLGSTVIIKKYRTQRDYSGGKSNGVTILHDGTLTLAPEAQQRLAPGISQIWRLAKAGSQLFAAAGSPAAVFAIKDNGDTVHVYQGQEAAVFALKADSRGNIWFAPSPGGTIYKYTKGRVSKVASLETTYIWDFLEHGQEMLVATGVPGLILKLDQAGKIDTFFTSSELHIRTLAAGKNGAVYAGSSDNGIVYQFDRDGKPSVLYDSPQTEIFSIIPASDGHLWAAGTKEGVPIPQPAAPQIAVSDFEIERGGARSKTTIVTPANGQRSSVSRSAANKGMIYKISPNGFAKSYWDNSFDRVQSMALDKKGILLVGSGDAGKLYRIGGENQIDMLLEFEPSQITHLLADQDKTYIATANLGSCYVLHNRPVRTGEYLSQVLDADFQASWGSLSWKSAGKISFYTRSGNSAEPDVTWSDWSPAMTNSAGSPVDSPPARFLQWRAELKSNKNQEPRVTAVDIGYLPMNIAPKIEEITIYEYGTAFPDAVEQGLRKEALDSRQGRNGERPRRAQNTGKKVTLPGFLSIGWKAKDPNKDEMVFELFYKKIDARHWRPLVSNYRATVYSWDSRTMPDGEYHVKIVASDRPGNIASRASEYAKVSAPFLVDNTPPTILSVKFLPGNPAGISFQARDKASRIAEAYYAIDAGEWMMLYPGDGVSDSRAENYHIQLPNLTAGEHTIMIKIFDENENVQYSHLDFKHQ